MVFAAIFVAISLVVVLTLSAQWSPHDISLSLAYVMAGLVVGPIIISAIIQSALFYIAMYSLNKRLSKYDNAAEVIGDMQQIILPTPPSE